jgi:hypothetical protein
MSAFFTAELSHQVDKTPDHTAPTIVYTATCNAFNAVI